MHLHDLAPQMHDLAPPRPQGGGSQSIRPYTGGGPVSQCNGGQTTGRSWSLGQTPPPPLQIMGCGSEESAQLITAGNIDDNCAANVSDRILDLSVCVPQMHWTATESDGL
eukprot:30527-Rhodomonas_salina.1